MSSALQRVHCTTHDFTDNFTNGVPDYQPVYITHSVTYTCSKYKPDRCTQPVTIHLAVDKSNDEPDTVPDTWAHCITNTSVPDLRT